MVRICDHTTLSISFSASRLLFTRMTVAKKYPNIIWLLLARFSRVWGKYVPLDGWTTCKQINVHAKETGGKHR